MSSMYKYRYYETGKCESERGGGYAAVANTEIRPQYSICWINGRFGWEEKVDLDLI